MKPRVVPKKITIDQRINGMCILAHKNTAIPAVVLIRNCTVLRPNKMVRTTITTTQKAQLDKTLNCSMPERTLRVQKRKVLLPERLITSSLHSLPLLIEPAYDFVIYFAFSVGFERVQKQQTGHMIVFASIFYISRIDNHTQRPMQGLIDRNKYKFLFKDIDALLCCPFLHSTRPFVNQGCEEMRAKAVYFGAKAVKIPCNPEDENSETR